MLTSFLMNHSSKTAISLFLNFAFCTNQLLADLPPVTFDSADWVPYESIGLGNQPGWQLFSGDAQVSAAGAGVNGGKALRIPVNAQEETRISRTVAWDVAETTAFIDFQVKPAADPVEKSHDRERASYHMILMNCSPFTVSPWKIALSAIKK